MSLLAVDPGLRGCGVAYFSLPDGVLCYANYIRNPVTEGDGPGAWYGLAEAVYHDFRERELKVTTYVVEVMQVYRRSPGDPNDLIQIAGVSGAIGACFPLERAVGYQPRAWKGTIKKEIAIERFKAQLTEDEKARCEEKRATYAHNMWDACGLGLYELERMRVRLSR